MNARGFLLGLALAALGAVPALAQIGAEIPLDLDQPEAAVALVERQARAGAGAGAFDHQRLHDLYEGLDENDALRLRLLNALARLDLAAPDALADEDELWSDQARLLAKTGAPSAEVLAALKRMVGAEALLDAGLDPRFAAARALEPAWFEPRAVVMRGLERADRMTGKHANRLGLVRLRADLLERLGRPAEALALADAALLRFQVSPQSFVDAESALSGVRVERAFSLWQLGRFDEAIAEDRVILKAARAEEDYNGWADSQLILHLDAAGEAQAALKALDYFVYRNGEVMADWVAARSACVNLQLGRLKAARRDLAELKAKDDLGRPALTYALLCFDDLDGAAAAYKARLADPDRAGWAIMALSPRARAKGPAPRDLVNLARQAKVAARPDVQAALAAAGGPRPSPLTPSGGEIW